VPKGALFPREGQQQRACEGAAAKGMDGVGSTCVAVCEERKKRVVGYEEQPMAEIFVQEMDKLQHVSWHLLLVFWVHLGCVGVDRVGCYVYRSAHLKHHDQARRRTTPPLAPPSPLTENSITQCLRCTKKTRTCQVQKG